MDEKTLLARFQRVFGPYEHTDAIAAVVVTWVSLKRNADWDSEAAFLLDAARH
ncbi:MAG: hypothetical protein ABI348_07365 [Nitrososphaera sp.]